MINIWTDGATLGHNGKLGTVKTVGLGIFCESPRITIAEKVKGGSNNESEFLALIRGMEEAIKLNLDSVHFFLDSRIVVNRANGSRPKKKKHFNARMNAFQDKVFDLAECFNSIRFSWIPREQNTKADYLSKKALGLCPDYEF